MDDLDLLHNYNYDYFRRLTHFFSQMLCNYSVTKIPDITIVNLILLSFMYSFPNFTG